MLNVFAEFCKRPVIWLGKQHCFSGKPGLLYPEGEAALLIAPLRANLKQKQEELPCAGSGEASLCRE